jgi:thiamine-phosphate diphosphorylase
VSLPRLHVVTDDAILDRADFLDHARALLRAHGPAIALHVRARHATARRLLTAAAALVETAASVGGTVLVNDRIDIALAAGAHGVHLRERSMPPADARGLVGRRLLGRSIHDAGGVEAVARWTDFLFLGTIYPTASHSGSPALGPRAIAELAAATELPVLAIGGLDVGRVAEVLGAGAHGVAVIGGVWGGADPVERAGAYLQALERPA